LNLKAFSIAEAMITLLVVSIAIAASAPLISRQMKNSNISNTQIRHLQQQIDELRTQIEEGAVPAGTVAFFDLGTCPGGWTALDANYAGRFIRIAGTDTGGTNYANRSFQNQSIQSHNHGHNLSIGNVTLNNMQLVLSGGNTRYNLFNPTINYGGGGGPYAPLLTSKNTYYGGWQKASERVSITGTATGTLSGGISNAGSTETRPKNVAFLACKKD